jgi:hypothetical protein
MYLLFDPSDNPSQLLSRVVRQPRVVYAVLQVLIGLPASRALPQKFFGGYIGVVVLVVCNLKDELIDFDAVVIHRS